MTEALAPADERWDRLVEAAPTPDVYFRPGYCTAYEEAGHGQAVAVQTDGALFPLLLRELPFGDEGFDAITPYGYGGFLPLGGAGAVEELHELRAWCVANGVVSVLVRLHPLVGGFGDLSGLDWAEVREHGPTTAIAPAGLDENGRRELSKGRRSDLVVARRELEVSWDRGPAALERFRAVYDATMRRLGAADYYLFPPEYYWALADGLGERLGLALALRDGEVVGGALFLADRRWAHYHLSGTTEAGRELKAGTLLVYEGARWARERGCELLHLGGGTSGADSLFAFKKSFGGDTYTYSFATLVADPERYDALVARRAREPEPRRPDFFPAYRA